MVASSSFEFLAKNSNIDLIVTRDSKDSKVIQNVAKYLNFETFVLPDFRANVGDDLKSFQDELFEITMTLYSYLKSRESKKVLISPVRTILNRLPKEDLLQTLRVEFANELNLSDFKELLLNWGYNFVDVVEAKGEVSFRGDIVDIFPINLENPLRISLFDIEVEEIREFDINSQRSKKEEIESFEIFPAPFSLSKDDYEKLNLKIEQDESNTFVKDITSLGFWYLEELATDYLRELKSIFAIGVKEEIEEIALFRENLDREFLNSISIMPEAREYKDLIVGNFKEFIEYHKDRKIKLLSISDLTTNEFREYPNIEIVKSDVILNLISNREIIISLNREKRKKRANKPSIILDELKVGEYVVHQNYGVGIFEGIKQSRVLGAVKDVVSIKYQGDDKLLIPIENIDIIDRYIADSGATPTVDKLGKGTFAKLKAKVKEKLLEIAKDIISIAAKRELIEGKKINCQMEEIKLFQNSAGFVYTVDQKLAVESIFEDLASSRVMDKLLSGDVGFGKTEVAMNAMFPVAKSGYQSAMIAPTTLLSNQHFKSLRDRFEKFDIRVAKLDRFVTAKEKKVVLKGLKEGEIDVVVGTHSILSAEFENLALVIIDEEHKFGVKQKEKLKELSENCHLLSMSATPIPRTLNLAMSQIKTFSELKTPPTERVGVKTFVKEFSDSVIKEVILRELRRGGQIFYVYNEIATIEAKKIELLRILPNLKISILHSKISALESEKEMLKFENREYDLLLSTSIVESGIHMPKVNSIIIDGSDRFGIADLHQLRGRVGRGSREGYCYFIVKDKSQITEDAKRRLIALESNSYLGSGANLAQHDLEIRGGGNILGTAQSGNIKGVGYSLYLSMLEDTINLLTGKESIKKEDIDLKLTVNAFISSDLINEDRVRLELYRRLSKCENLENIRDIEEEMIDRFGKLDIPTKHFLLLITIKILARAKNIKTVTNYNQNITFIYSSDKKETIQANSRDEDDILDGVLKFLRR